MIKGNLYFTKDEFFDKFPDQMLLTNKPISIATDTKSEINAKLRKILRLNKKGLKNNNF